jgi:hypothetical protein
MYPGRRFALPWAISFCPFGAAGSMVDRHLPGPSTPAEGVPALRAYAATRLLFTGAFDPGRGCAGPSGLCATRLLLTGAFDPGRGCAGPSGLWGTRLLLTGAFDPGRGCASPSGLCGHKFATYRGLRPRQRVYRPFGPMQPQDCYLPGPSWTLPSVRKTDPQFSSFPL